jgi:hypothetical protein
VICMEYCEQQKDTQRLYLENAPRFFCELTFGEDVQVTGFAAVQRTLCSQEVHRTLPRHGLDLGRPGGGGGGGGGGGNAHNGQWCSQRTVVPFPASLEWDRNASMPCFSTVWVLDTMTSSPEGEAGGGGGGVSHSCETPPSTTATDSFPLFRDTAGAETPPKTPTTATTDDTRRATPALIKEAEAETEEEGGIIEDGDEEGDWVEMYSYEWDRVYYYNGQSQETTWAKPSRVTTESRQTGCDGGLSVSSASTRTARVVLQQQQARTILVPILLCFWSCCCCCCCCPVHLVFGLVVVVRYISL